jgi:hypothetical protein
MNKVLLLNKNESLLNVIDWQTAVCLYVQGKAIKPYGYEDYFEIKTVKGVFLLPTALVTVDYINIPYRQAQLTKTNLLKRDKNACAYCGRELNNSNSSIDHIIPVSRWLGFVEKGKTQGKSPNNWKNVVIACKPCNCKKDARTPEEAGMKLRIKPYVPSREYLVLKGIELRTREAWERWIQISDDLQ